MMARLAQFLEAEDGRLSLSRLLSLLSFWPASWVVLTVPTEGMMGIYLTAYAVAYLGGKGLDAMMAKRAENPKE